MEGIPSVKDRRKIGQKILKLAENPRPEGSIKLSGEEKCRLRHRHYRIVYGVEDEKLKIRVVKIAQRKALKEAVLENGIMVMVPQFIETGEVIRIDVQKKAYLERVGKK